MQAKARDRRGRAQVHRLGRFRPDRVSFNFVQGAKVLFLEQVRQKQRPVRSGPNI